MGGKHFLNRSKACSTANIVLQPYFNHTLAAGNPKLAAAFIPKCTSLTYTERIEMWLKCGMANRAGEEALKAKDREMLEDIRSKASSGQQLDIDRMIAQLSKGR